MSEPVTAILIFISFCIVIFIVALVKKIFYKVMFKKRYYIFPRTSIKGITSIAMVIALSVAVLILLVIITSNLVGVLFRAFPGTRITIESILIKIGGLLFGPFIGMFIGMFTDLLSVTLTAGVFHYGYFIAAMCFGLLSGLVRTIILFSSHNKLKFAIYTSLSILLVSILAMLYFGFVSTEKLYIPFLPFDIEKEHIIYVIVSFIFLSIVSIWVFYFMSLKRNNSKKKATNKFGKPSIIKKINLNFFEKYCPVISCIMITEVLVNVLMMPIFDAEISTLTINTWLAIRLLLFVPMVFLNLFIIFPVYAIVSPLVTYDYRKDVVEDASLPLYNL
ncbi:MAG: hypothetical protein RSA40_00615 [Malacoplasma sp.]